MIITKKIFLLLAFFFIGGCSAVQVSQDFDVTTEFTRYQTFAWAPEPPQRSNDILMDSQLMDRRIRRAVGETLSIKGLSQTPGGEADFYVTYHIVVRPRLEVDSFSTGFGGYGYRYPYWGYPYPFWGGIDYSTYIRQYDEGTLIIDFTDARNSQLFWRGIGTRRITQQSTPEKITAAVNETVADILAQYPPSVE